MINSSCFSVLNSDYIECPGRYCGRVILNENNCTLSQCQKCPRGYRPEPASMLNLCLPCTNEFSLYDYMYLGSMLNCSLVLHFLFIDHSIQILQKKINYLDNFKVSMLYLFAFVECSIAFVLSILIFSPENRPFQMQTCSVDSLYDWYTIFFNPYIDYYNKLNCTQEIVYPLFSFLIVFFLLAIGVMVVTRPIFLRLLFSDKSLLKVLDKPIFAALYFFPVLIMCHIVAGGVLYYSYPIITIVYFLISNAFYLCKEFKTNQSFRNDLITNLKIAFNLFKRPRHLFIILAHWYFYAFSLIAIVEFKLFYFNYYYLLFVPAPLIFFVVSYKYTDPKNFKN